MTLTDIEKLITGAENVRVLRYDRNGKYIDTITYSKYGGMFSQTPKQRERAETRMDSMRNTPHEVTWISPADYYLDIGVKITCCRCG